MKAIARSLVVILVAVLTVPALVVSVAITSAVQLLAATALIMGGTQHPLSSTGDTDAFVNEYFGQALNHYIVHGTGQNGEITPYAVVYPAEFFPAFGTTTFENSVSDGVGNLGHCLGAAAGTCSVNNNPGVNGNGNPPAPGDGEYFIVFGYSQSAVVASLVKNQMIEDGDLNPYLDGTEFFLVSNPMRANGGILARGFEGFTIPIIGIPFYGPTKNSCDGPTCSPDDDYVFPTVDAAAQYDFLGGDAPARLSPLAFANSIASYALLHGNMPTRNIDDGVDKDVQIVYQGKYGDTTYYMVTAPRLPLLMLLEQAGVPGPALALPDALLRVWIEDKYRRDLSPGQHVKFQLSPIGNPINLVGNMLGAIPVGIDDTVQQATGPNSTLRPLGTANVYRPFGVGGPVYDKTTGEQAEDNVGVPNPTPEVTSEATPEITPEAPLALTQPEPAAKQAAAKEQTNVIEAQQGETPDASAPSKATRPRPLQVIRESLNFNPPKRPLGIRPGNGPLSRIVKTLTGQRPTGTKANQPDNEPSDSGDSE
ncbi:PE-PPE domain-containing protein [Mycolicibacterium agri]|uniref:PE-PPE domain-containing protein n=1 Tax=Mycolicibacterium agri TaxID=36811 RepID=A0A2A7N1J9_MYCAG|nr:PE-PPE domain-containing protein [Mycolicibacterium agri]PEG37627.1 PE-PPE domain-containing protein [Mycolicibacterium agri]GFG55627.1 PE-PPE domain-containing protein [Mycolicibacterium agri]